MIQLTTEEKQFINTTLKPLLKKDNWDKIRQECYHHQNILGFFAENGLNVFSGLTKIPKGMFQGSDISRITIPKEIKVIGENAFRNCFQLNSITFEDGVEEIEPEAFWGCTNLVQVDLPESLIKLNARVFRDCTGLKQITLPNSITVLPNLLFTGCDENLVIYAQSRKDLPKNQKLKCPKEEVDWYVKHLKVLDID